MNKNDKKELSVLIADGSESKQYIDFLNEIYNVKVIDIKKVKSSKEIDLVLFTGGEDVNPYHYDENVGEHTKYNDKRDAQELNIFNSFYSVPKLGIGKGAQLLTMQSGGSIIQHVEGHQEAHQITINNYGTYNITSTHHQMCNPYKLKAKNYTVLAHSTQFRSTTYLDGNNNEIDLVQEFLEPEIIVYHQSKALAIQGHPETENCDKNTKEVIQDIIYNWLEGLTRNRPEPTSLSFAGPRRSASMDMTTTWITSTGQTYKSQRIGNSTPASISYSDYMKMTDEVLSNPTVKQAPKKRR